MENAIIAAEAFAELMRQMAGGVLRDLVAQDYEGATRGAEALLNEALRCKREFRHALDMENPDRFDLSALVVDPNAPNDEADGLARD